MGQNGQKNAILFMAGGTNVDYDETYPSFILCYVYVRIY